MNELIILEQTWRSEIFIVSFREFQDKDVFFLLFFERYFHHIQGAAFFSRLVSFQKKLLEHLFPRYFLISSSVMHNFSSNKEFISMMQRNYWNSTNFFKRTYAAHVS